MAQLNFDEFIERSLLMAKAAGDTKRKHELQKQDLQNLSSLTLQQLQETGATERQRMAGQAHLNVAREQSAGQLAATARRGLDDLRNTQIQIDATAGKRGLEEDELRTKLWNETFLQSELNDLMVRNKRADVLAREQSMGIGAPTVTEPPASTETALVPTANERIAQRRKKKDDDYAQLQLDRFFY
jgi:hypothetical protein